MWIKEYNEYIRKSTFNKLNYLSYLIVKIASKDVVNEFIDIVKFDLRLNFFGLAYQMQEYKLSKILL